jgi:uncharacterized CHY-type Zn-finger protein
MVYDQTWRTGMHFFRKSGLVLTLFHCIVVQYPQSSLHQAIRNTALTKKERKRKEKFFVMFCYSSSQITLPQYAQNTFQPTCKSRELADKVQKLHKLLAIVKAFLTADSTKYYCYWKLPLVYYTCTGSLFYLTNITFPRLAYHTNPPKREAQKRR